MAKGTEHRSDNRRGRNEDHERLQYPGTSCVREARLRVVTAVAGAVDKEAKNPT